MNQMGMSLDEVIDIAKQLIKKKPIIFLTFFLFNPLFEMNQVFIFSLGIEVNRYKDSQYYSCNYEYQNSYQDKTLNIWQKVVFSFITIVPDQLKFIIFSRDFKHAYTGIYGFFCND